MDISQKIKHSFLWLSGVLMLATTLVSFAPAQQTKALTDPERNNIYVAGLAYCLFHKHAIREGSDQQGDITSYWDDEGNREVVAVGYVVDSTDGVWTCNEVLRAAAPIIGITATDVGTIRTELEKKILGNTYGLQEKGTGGMPGDDFERAAINYMNTELLPLISGPPTGAGLAERVLPLIDTCFTVLPGSLPNFTFQTSIKNGSTISLDFKKPTVNSVVSEYSLNYSSGGGIPYVDIFGDGAVIYVGDVHSTGRSYDDQGQLDLTGIGNSSVSSTGTADYSGWQFYVLGGDFNNDFSDNGKWARDSGVLVDCKYVQDRASDIFGQYELNASNELTFGGKTASDVRDQGAQDANFNLSNGDRPTCEGADALGWIMCPIIAGILSLNDAIFRNFIEPFLRFEPVNTTTGPLYAIWSSFRTVGNILLVFGLLFIVFGQAIGGGLIDAYTAKKAMPRIFIAAILINLSIYIVAFMIDMGNILGAGIGQMITAPLYATGQGSYRVDGALSSIAFIGLIVGAVIAILLGLSLAKDRGGDERASSSGGTFTASSGKKVILYSALFFGFPLLLIIIGIFATLIVRMGTLMLLIVISPVALALFVMPSTDKYAKKWFDILLKTIIVYPIIVALFAIADVLSILLSFNVQGIDFSKLISSALVLPATGIAGLISGDGLPDLGTGISLSSIFISFVSIVVLFVPLAMIPFSFKIAGGLMGSLIGAVTKARAGTDKLVRGDKHDPYGRFRKFSTRQQDNLKHNRDGMFKQITSAKTNTGMTTLEAIGEQIPGLRGLTKRRRNSRRGVNPATAPAPPQTTQPSGTAGGRGARVAERIRAGSASGSEQSIVTPSRSIIPDDEDDDSGDDGGGLPPPQTPPGLPPSPGGGPSLPPPPKNPGNNSPASSKGSRSRPPSPWSPPTQIEPPTNTPGTTFTPSSLKPPDNNSVRNTTLTAPRSSTRPNTGGAVRGTNALRVPDIGKQQASNVTDEAKNRFDTPPTTEPVDGPPPENS